ncbi:MAG: prepilin peptidase [Candidatus Scatovivens sp.]
MEILMIIMIFFLGTVFGSFFTLAVYRIPLGKNITHERSFCPNCMHKLGFKDLIPVVSYVFLKGKCRYCGQKVRPRYLILEILSGIVFVLIYISLKINVLGITYLYLGINFNNTLEKLIYFLAFIYFYIANALIIGIDNEYKQINSKVLNFGIITQILYMIYLCIFVKSDIYIIYLITLVFLIIINICTMLRNKKQKAKNYIIQNIIYLLYIISFIEIKNIIILIPICMITYLIYKIYVKNKVKKDETINSNNKQIPIGFCLGISAIITTILINYIN